MPQHGLKWSKDRVERALARDEEASHRKPSEQLSILDRRLGSGQGATRERTRLGQLIREGLDFPSAQRLELIKNKAKKQKKEENDEASGSTATENGPQDKSDGNSETSGGSEPDRRRRHSG